MTTLKITERGQVTFRKEVLRHLGVQAGEKIELSLLPNGEGLLRAAKPSGRIDAFIGSLAGKTHKVATIEEMSKAAMQGWAGEE
jgi:bifunctional DNA-binding transcriptional regulator/antitoxin component of YhaV-PrlF toxin-antitoxin module